MNKPTCTIQAWLCQSQTFFFSLVVSPESYFCSTHNETRSKRETTPTTISFIRRFFSSSVPWVKHDVAVCVSLLAVGVSNFILFDNLWLLHMCASCSTQRLGLWVYWSLWPLHLCILCCLCRAFKWKSTHTNTSDLELFALELDRWYSDRKKLYLENVRVWKCANSTNNNSRKDPWKKKEPKVKREREAGWNCERKHIEILIFVVLIVGVHSVSQNTLNFSVFLAFGDSVCFLLSLYDETNEFWLQFCCFFSSVAPCQTMEKVDGRDEVQAQHDDTAKSGAK